MRSLLTSEFGRLFRIGVPLLVCSAAAVVLASLGMGVTGLWVLAGLGLFLVNAFVLYRAARSLLRAATGRGVALAGLLGGGRMVLLAVVLGLAGLMGVQALLACAGSLLFCQANLQVGSLLGNGRTRWTDT